MKRLVVIAGPGRSGKMTLTRRLMADAPYLVLVRRDTLRAALVTPVDEWVITLIMRDAAARLLLEGYSVIVCAWNLERADRELWDAAAMRAGIPLEWMDVREPEVARLIPPVPGATSNFAS